MLRSITFLTIFYLMLTACGSGSSKPNSLPEFVVNGDPDNLLVGAVRDTISPFKTAEVRKWDNYFLASGAVFYSVRKNVGGKSKSQIESENETTGEGDEAAVFYKFRQDGAAWIYEATSGSKNISLRFKESAGLLDIESLSGEAVTIMHYSVLKTGDAFSLLLKSNDGTDDETIIVLYFVTGLKTSDAPAAINEKYTTLLGNGVAVRWEEDIAVTLCGNPSEVKNITSAVQQWLVDGSIGKRKMSVTATTSAAPFSDMNTHCVMAISDYIVDDSTEYSTLGITLPIVNNAQRIIGSDVFVFEKPHERFQSARSTYENATFIHEFGHFLGLGHPFKKDADGNALYPSIMGYDQITEIQAYDREAIAALYK